MLKISYILMAGATLAMLASCGGGSDSGDDNATPPATPPTESTSISEVSTYTVEQVILPQYLALQTQAQAFSTTVSTHCVAGISQAQVDAIVTGYHALQDTWMPAQINFLPLHPSDQILSSIDVWIENTTQARVSTKINELLNQGGPYTENTVAHYGTAVQGIPAIEYLIYGSKLDPITVLDANRCALLTAVSAYTATISTQLYDAWNPATQNYADQLLQPEIGKDYTNEKDVIDSILNAPYIALEVIKTSKLTATLNDIDSVTKSESWRSQRSLRNVRINLQAIKTYLGLDTQSGLTATLTEKGQSSAITLFTRYVDEAIAIVQAAEDSAINHDERVLSLAADKLDLAIDVIAADFMPALNVTPNFNSFDGD